MKARLICTLMAASALALTAAGSTSSHTLQGTTRTTVASSAKRTVHGQKVTFTATVARLSGSGKLTGKVEFYDREIIVGFAAVRPAEFLRVTFTTNALGVRTHTITAVYSGNPSFAGSTSRALRLRVNAAATTTIVSASPSASVYGQEVTFTATVTAKAPGGGTPTGSVRFAVNSQRFDPYAHLSHGKAVLTTSSLTVGSHAVSAAYLGARAFKISESESPRTLTVGKASTGTVAVSTVTESPSGTSMTFTATVTPVAPGAGAPTGVVQFTNGSTSIGTATLSGGKAVLTVKRPGGAPTITAAYGGDANFTGSGSTVKADG